MWRTFNSYSKSEVSKSRPPAGQHQKTKSRFPKSFCFVCFFAGEQESLKCSSTKKTNATKIVSMIGLISSPKLTIRKSIWKITKLTKTGKEWSPAAKMPGVTTASLGDQWGRANFPWSSYQTPRAGLLLLALLADFWSGLAHCISKPSKFG